MRADTRRRWSKACTLEDYRRSLDPFVALLDGGIGDRSHPVRHRGGTVAQHDPIVLAKQIATLDHLSGGRFVFGMGFGWNREEAADHGVALRRAA